MEESATSSARVNRTKAQPVSNGGPSYGLQEINEPQAPLDAKREDGYFDGTIAIQGVRAYDPSMNQWTAPDAYSGDVHDPMSQHPYMWNENNPVNTVTQADICSSFHWVMVRPHWTTALLKGVMPISLG